MSNFRALIQPEFARNHVRLLVAEILNGQRNVLLENGAWQIVNEAEMDPMDAGIIFSHEALPVIAEALAKHLGNALPSQAEVVVLREWLAKEQSRVDIMFQSTVHITETPHD